jgi:hypothetical protein
VAANLSHPDARLSIAQDAGRRKPHFGASGPIALNSAGNLLPRAR